jgi:hypothetical protein
MDTAPPPAPKLTYKDRFNKLLSEWGSLVLWVYFGIFGVVLVGFALAIKFGFGVQGSVGAVGTWGAAYLATKLTQPLRIAATLVLTPALAALIKRFKKQPSSPESAQPPAVAPDATTSPRELPLDVAPLEEAPLDKPSSDAR